MSLPIIGSMDVLAEAATRLQTIQDVRVLRKEPLAPYTRFDIGGPAAVLVQTSSEESFAQALAMCAELKVSTLAIGGGSNLIVSDAGFDGVVLHFTGSAIVVENTAVHAQSGATLQALVDHTIDSGLGGLETMTGIPGYVGGAVYGNAGAYGHSIQEVVQRVHFTNGSIVRSLTNADCQFRYRESIFKSHKEWFILSVQLQMVKAEGARLSAIAQGIRMVRDAKYPPDMKCAGSIFKNVFFADLPPSVQAEVPQKLVRDGKIPSAWFLEQAGVKGLRRGAIQVASYHANLIYNDGAGSSADLLAVIDELKERVQARFGFSLEEEVQYVGFEAVPVAV